MSELEQTFARCRAEGRIALVAYLTVGYPTLAETPTLVEALLAGGFDCVELGVPFSDPLADGATIQRASLRALENGVDVAKALHVAAGLRGQGVAAPLLLMGYYNPFYSYGLARLAEFAAAAGVQGVIVPDLPPEEAGDLASALDGRGIDRIQMLAPTTPPARMATVCGAARGFLYCVSLSGVTGARKELPSDLAAFLGRVRQHTALPLAVGFGLSRPQHVAQVAKIADGAVVGSAIIDLIDSLPPAARPEGLRQYAASLRAATAVQ